MAKKAQTAFNMFMVASAIAEAIVGLTGAQGHKDALNSALRTAKAEGVKWGSQRHDGSLAWEIGQAILARGCTLDTVKVTLATVKWAYEQGVEVSTLTLSRLKVQAAKGAAFDLETGKPKTVKPTGKTKGTKAKTQATVKHCGIGLLAALEQEGFVKWLNHFIDKAEMMGIDSTSIDEEKLDLVRSTLVDCGYAVMEDGECKASIINAADNEVADDE